MLEEWWRRIWEIVDELCGRQFTDEDGEVCASAGRDASGVSLVAVTKHVSCDVAAALARLGQQDLGENRVDELERKPQSAYRVDH